MKNIYFPLNEIFVSVQGEGLNSGKLALFLRFGKCNLHCHFCDTKSAWYNYHSVSEVDIIKTLKKNRKKVSFLVLTGGEPCLNNLQNIVDYAKKLGYFIAVETNGTVYQKWLDKLDWVSVSPKNNNVDKRVLKLADELKFVILNKKSFKLVKNFVPFKNLILQPVDNKVSVVKLIINEIKKNKHLNSARLGIQLHKVFSLK